MSSYKPLILLISKVKIPIKNIFTDNTMILDFITYMNNLNSFLFNSGAIYDNKL